jgi:excisionase family DNA binding protein
VELLKTSQAADELGLSRFQVLRLIRLGELPAERVGRDYWIRREDVERLGAPGPAPELEAAWRDVLAPAAERVREGVEQVRTETQPRLVLARGVVTAAATLPSEFDRSLGEGLRTVLSAAGGMGILMDSYWRELRPPVARAFAARAGRAEPNLEDLAGADWLLPFMLAWIRAMTQSGFRRRSADVDRDIGAEWGLDLGRTQAITILPSALPRGAGTR